jgi:glutamine synthetase
MHSRELALHTTPDEERTRMTSTELNRGLESRIDAATLDSLAKWPAQGLSREDLAQLVDTGEIENVIVCAPDVQGKFAGKTVPARLFLAEPKLDLSSGVLIYDNNWAMLERLPDLGHANGWADMQMHADMRSLRRMSCLEKTALVIADGTWVSGAPVAQLPRQVLRRQLERAADQELAVVCAVECEFYVFAESYESAAAKNYNDLRRVGTCDADYSVMHLGRVDPLVADISRQCIASGIPIESIKHEWGRVQLELTLTYCDALEAADRIALFKLITKQVALRHGFAATFMARFSHQEGPSSGHVHLSLWDPDDRRNLMLDESGPGSLSELARHWLGGQMALVRELMPLFCPYTNSYKRLRVDDASIGPATNAWSIDVRSVPFRVIGHGNSLHLEHRTPGADANFYLAIAAIVASGLYGIEHELEPIGEPVTTVESPGELLPRSLGAANELFRNSARVREMLGDEVVNHLAGFADHEVDITERQVTDVERRRTFECA